VRPRKPQSLHAPFRGLAVPESIRVGVWESVGDRILCPTGHLLRPPCVSLHRNPENPGPQGTGWRKPSAVVARGQTRNYEPPARAHGMKRSALVMAGRRPSVIGSCALRDTFSDHPASVYTGTPKTLAHRAQVGESHRRSSHGAKPATTNPQLERMG